MSDKSAIEWTDATWNPVDGCSKISPACANCYIERTIPFRVAGRKFINGDIPLRFHESRLELPLKQKKPTTYFVNSLSDLFHPDIPDDFINRVYHTMEAAHWHTFQVLTKRAERMRKYLQWRYGPDADAPRGRIPSRHIWHGVSVENQRWLQRADALKDTPSAVRFLSCEPLLEDLGALILDGIDWVIVGGESGPRVRPTHPDWIRNVRDECQRQGVYFFFKQWGGRTAKSGGRILDGRTWDEMPGQGKH